MIDDTLAIEVIDRRLLRYTTPATEDRPPHVRSASGIAVHRGALYVVQDDTSFIAVVTGDAVDAIEIPYAPGGRRRFEKVLGNKLDKLDLEACVSLDDALVAFGSGSLAGVREHIVIAGAAVTIVDAGALYTQLRGAIGALNVEGAVIVRDELWLCHRGNCGPHDPGPAVIRIELAAFRAYLAGGGVPALQVDRYDLESIDGVRLGFTDATAWSDRVFVLLAAEASPNAIDDGHVVAAQIGVIDGDRIRSAPLVIAGASPKAEGIAFESPGVAWITVDPDDTEAPAPLYKVRLVGPW
ncbi:MAG: hypothetical protein ABI867_34550 [Kofleriaceae bacterium]